MFRGRFVIAALSAACATSAMAVVPPAGVDRTRIQSQVAQQPDPVADPRATVVQPAPEPPPQPPPPQGDPTTPAPEPTNSVIVGEPGPQTGRPPVAATIPANTVLPKRDNPVPPPDVDEEGSDAPADNEDANAENAANAAGDGDTNVVTNTTTGNGDPIPWWPILVVLGVVLIGGGLWALKRPVPIDYSVYDEPAINPPAEIADEPAPPQPTVPFSVRPSLDRAYGAGPPPNLDWAGPRTRIRTSLEPGATSWAE